MCSSDNDNDNDYNCSYSTSTFKKPKRQKVPKRGPGVAELEKILRDQNRKVDHPDTLLSSSSSSSSSPNSYHYHLHPQLPSFFSSSSFSHLNPTIAANVTPTSPQMPSGYLFPITPPIKSNQNHMLQRKHSQMVNLFVDSALPSFSTSPFYHHVEPPSNQTCYQHYASILPQEEKMIGMKRPRSFSFDNTQIPPLIHYQCSPHLNSSSLSHSRSNIGLTHMTSREAMVEISLDLNSKSSFTTGGNSITFASNSSTSSQNCQQEFSKFSPFSIQYEKKESIEDLQQRSSTSSSTHKPPFHSFLSTEHEQEYGAETTLSLNGQTVEAKSDGIDLNLKL